MREGKKRKKENEQTHFWNRSFLHCGNNSRKIPNFSLIASLSSSACLFWLIPHFLLKKEKSAAELFFIYYFPFNWCSSLSLCLFSSFLFSHIDLCSLPRESQAHRQGSQSSPTQRKNNSLYNGSKEES